MTDRSQRFISPDSVKRAAQYFRDTDFEHGDHLTYFLIFKYIGAENRAVQLNDEIKRKAREAVFYLMSLYGSSENAPEREQITYPFSLPEQRLTVPLKRFANSDSFNNVRNNPGRYEGILEYDSETEEYNIAFNYLDELVEHCNLIQNKIDLNMLSAWVLRDQPFEINVNMSSQRFTSGVRLLFKDLFNITEKEETKMFHSNGPLINHSSSKVNMSEIRELLGLESDKELETPLPSIRVDQEIASDTFSLEGQNSTKNEVLEALDKEKQLLFYGPPGTSKTYRAREIAEEFQESTFVQFHQSYSYEEFIGGTRVRQGRFKTEKGRFTKITEEAKENPESQYLLIIDEINRGNVSEIFGEVISILDREGEVSLSYDPSIMLSIPDNLYIIGTMNTADRSIAFVDYALRRRFGFLKFTPDLKLLSKVTDDNDPSLDDISVVSLFNKINGRIKENLDPELQLGHTYFMPHEIKDEETGMYQWNAVTLQNTFNLSVYPLLEEYCYGDRSELETILSPQLIRSRRDGKEEFARALREYLQ